MALGVLLEVGPGELEGVEHGVGGGQLHVVGGLVALHPVDDGGEDVVTFVLEAPGVNVLNIQQELKTI